MADSVDAENAELLELCADVWDEAVEATLEWVERTGRPSDIGPPDPPQNPYDAALRTVRKQ